MSLPILAYGHPMLRTPCEDVKSGHPGLEQLIERMWATLYGADGCGLAASQVGQLLRLFLVDSTISYNNMNPESRLVYFDSGPGVKEVFINATIKDYSGRVWKEEEGCLSIPGLQVEVERPWSIHIEYFDQDFQPRQKEFSGITARMIQHEFDHTRGVLHIDQLTAFRKKLLNGKIRKISKGQVRTTYPMQFP